MGERGKTNLAIAIQNISLLVLIGFLFYITGNWWVLLLFIFGSSFEKGDC